MRAAHTAVFTVAETPARHALRQAETVAAQQVNVARTLPRGSEKESVHGFYKARKKPWQNIPFRHPPMHASRGFPLRQAAILL